VTEALALPANEAPFGVGAAVRWAVVRDLRLAMRSRAELGVQLLFYVIVVSLFPLASSPERTLLATMGPGVIWVAALLASLLSLPRLFASDFTDGTLEQIALSPPAARSYPARSSHWLTTGLPIVGSRRWIAVRTRRADSRHRDAGAAGRHRFFR
jgi:heme exporter protein CcmB